MGFENIKGYEDIKEELRQLADILQNRDIYYNLGTTVPHGLLLHGIPGVGKTLMANEFLNEIDRNVFRCRKDKPNGEFIEDLKSTFDKAKEQAPSAVFLDDMDKFSDADRYDQNTEAFVTIQTCIDEIEDKDVFVIATANDTYSFPSSLLRAGRFDRIIEVNVPRGTDAEAIVAHYIKDKHFVKDIDAKLIARIMDGHSCADLEKVINEAGIVAGFKRKSQITMEHFVEACMRTVFRISPEAYRKTSVEICAEDYLFDFYTGSEDMPMIACHEAGHAVLSELLIPESVTLISAYGGKTGEGGFTSFYREPGIGDLRWKESRIITSLGGMAAVEQQLGKSGSGTSADLNEAFEIVHQLISLECISGFSYHNVGRKPSDELRSRQEQAAAAEIEKYYRRAKELLASHKEFHQALWNALMRKKLLTATDIRAIKKQCHFTIQHKRNAS